MVYVFTDLCTFDKKNNFIANFEQPYEREYSLGKIFFYCFWFSLLLKFSILKFSYIVRTKKFIKFVIIPTSITNSNLKIKFGIIKFGLKNLITNLNTMQLLSKM